ncbi:flagellar biosynthesis protein FlhF [Hydrogenovibrio marinus]|uniref:Flagellar biosynthesis protein FlhF n=1 Tax=Hydrogenovibrio marinus TaxID=28885 RepID=A0A066ZXH5_HYDMR|nr:flagellar biosynthesis protein FlhF [Hydrogenovibrio marinus]KDN94795.1 flagellar biosynthesis regulator FlhF [Hydrogenovibrio marinus]BBN59253.1 flagellar biosynthesis protein FlhF [Hydrogenovibrio marinus]
MKLKRYLGPNMRQVMALVRDELGDDAVIMSTRNTDEGVEIVAAIDPESSMKQEAPLQQGARASFTSPELSHQSGQGFGKENQEIQKMATELQAVKTMLKDQLAGLAWNHSEKMEPEKVRLLKRLVQLGIGWDLAQELVSGLESLNDNSWSEVLVELERRIPTGMGDVVDMGGVVALVGPTGVGKTTTIAKMASRFVMRNSPSQLALITTDCYKIGAQAQLKTFADLLGVPVYVAASEGELLNLLASLTSKKLILIDTAGLSQKDSLIEQQPTKTKMGLETIRNYLVMSAATQLSVMKDIVSAFGKVGLKGCILTKLDEATQLGNILTVLIEHKLPPVYVSNGQRVPEDLEPVKIRDLVDKAMVLGQQKSVNEEEVAFRLGMGKDISDAQ